MRTRLYTPLKDEALRYLRWSEANPPMPMNSQVAAEGAGSELRSPLFHYGTVLPVYFTIIRYLSLEKTLRGKRLVELGSGTGRVLSYIQGLFPELEVVGTDYSKDCVAYAQKTYGIYGVTFIHTPAQQTVLKARSFDFVISSHVIEHLTKADGPLFIREVMRLLRSGGRAYIGTPERRMSQDLYAKNPDDVPALRLVPPHEHEYTLSELKALGLSLAPKNKVHVDKLFNPLFRKVFVTSIERFRPDSSLLSTISNALYRAARDYAPTLWFDAMTRWGSIWQIKRIGENFKSLLLANEVGKESDKQIADNLLLVIHT